MKWKMIRKCILAFSIIFVVIGSLAAHAGTFPEVMFILDASGSMWGKVGDKTKIEVAKEVMASAVPTLPKEVRVGLTVYGHRKKGDCTDVQILIPCGSDDHQGLLKKVRSLSPKGKTPIAASIKMVAEKLKTKENETTIILVSDGIETCHDDPCGVVKALKQSSIKFIIHVVGFGVDTKATEQLKCIASAGGGKYFGVADASALASAFEAVKEEVTVKVEKAKTTKVKAKTRLGKLMIAMPQSAVVSLAGINITRTKDNKLIKKASPSASATHPLLSGKYKAVLAFANPNYRPPTEVPIGEYQVNGGETTELNLGAVVINIAKELGKAIAAVGLVDQATGKPMVTIVCKDNDYYLFKPKPVPPGTYSLTMLPARSKTPVVVAKDLEVKGGKEIVATLDSGIALKKAPGVVGWDFLPASGGKPVLEIRRRWDNDYPLWYKFPVQPGTYGLQVHMKGMKEPLLAGEGIEIKKGQTIIFDAGL